MNMITVEMLEKLGACKSGIKYFKKEHGEEAPLDEVLSNPLLDPDHAAWLGRMLPAEYMGWEARLELQYDGYTRSILGRYCPGGVEGATWEARLALQRNKRSRTIFGRICPVGVEGATWEARLALQDNTYSIAHLGRHCPDGVEGATLEARLTVQLDEWGRAYVRRTFGGEQ